MFFARLSPARLWSLASAAVLVILFPLASSAQPVYSPESRDAYSVSSWQRLQDLSAQLESQATRTRQEAKIDARHHGSDELVERLDDFAKDAHVLRLLTRERDVSPSKIDDQVRKLVDDARKVQNESAKAERHDPQTDSDWNRTVGVLDDINNEYLAANGLAGGTTRTYGSEHGYRGRSWSDGGRAMVSNLDRRADDAARLSESANLDIAPEIERLRDQVRSFQRDMDDLSPADTRANIAHMLSDTRAAQADLSGSNAPQQLREDVNAMAGMLEQMRDMTAEREEFNTPHPAGTRGYGASPGVTGDRDEAFRVPDLARDLNRRVQRASEMARQYDLDDVSNDIAHIRDRVSDFANRAPNLSPHERRETIDGLLKDAQKTQRDLVSRHVASDLTSEWDGIVDLLLQMRTRAE